MAPSKWQLIRNDTKYATTVTRQAVRAWDDVAKDLAALFKREIR